MNAAGLLAALTRAIDRAATAGDAAIVRARAEALGLPHGRDPALPLDVLARFAPADLRAHLWAEYGGALDSVATPILCDHLAAVVGAPSAGAPDAVTVAEALAALARRHGHTRTPVHDRIDRVASALTARACRSTDHLRDLLDAPDFPDLRTISLDLLRIEGVRWVLDILGSRAALATLSDHSRRLSRLTLKRSGTTIRTFIGKPDLLALYDNLAVVTQVDNLLVVAARLLDALRDQEEERTPLVTPDDESALRGFGAALNDLAGMLARIALKSVGRTDVTPGLVTCTLDQLRFLHQFTERLGAAPPEFIALDHGLRGHALAIAERFKVTIRAKPPAPDSAPLLDAQARALSHLLSGLGLDAAEVDA